MPWTPELRPLGLMPDGNPLALPPGALKRAENCIIRKPGVLEPRPGFYDTLTGNWTPTTGYEVRTIIPFDDDAIAISYNGAAWKREWASDGTDALSGNPAVSGELHFGHARARGNLYVTSSSGVLRHTAGGSTRDYVGIPRARSGHCAAGGGSRYVAYRVVWRWEDANGNIIRSAPSGRFGTNSFLHTAPSTTLTIPLKGAFTSMFLEIYRTPSSTTVDVGDDMQLVREHQPTSTEVSAGYCTIYDKVLDGDLGASLYTNASQFGAAQENGRPPLAGDIAHFKGSMFYARTSARPSALFTLNEAGRFDYRQIGDDFTITANVTISSTTMSTIAGIAASESSQLRVGQLVMESGQSWGADGTHIKWPTYVASINSSSSVVLSQVALASGTGITVTFHDTLKLGSNYYVMHSATDETVSPGRVNWNMTAGGAGSTVPRLLAAGDLAFVINYRETDYIASVVSDGDKVQILIESASATSWSSFTVQLSNGEAWAPNTYPGGAEDAVHTVEAETVPGRLMWSRADLPEAVPPVNVTDVGDREQPIYRIVPAGDALWIFKADGVWKLTGSGADAGWRIDRVSAARIVGPRAACDFGDDACVWLDSGVHLVSSTLIPIDDAVQQTIGAAVTAKALQGAWVRSNRLEREVYVGVPDAAADDHAGKIYVYNLNSKAWTTWEIGSNDLVVGESLSLLLAKADDGTFGYREERVGTTYDCADEQYTISLTDNGDGTYTDTVTDWAPAVGDRTYVVAEGIGGPIVVTTFVTSATGSTVTLSGTPGLADTAFVAIPCVIEWVVNDGGAPQALKHWIEGSLGWLKIFDAYTFTVGFKGETNRENQTADETAIIVNALRDPDGAAVTTTQAYEETSTEFYVPRSACLSSVLRPRLEISQAGVCWELSHLTMEYEPVSTAHRRTYGS